MICIRACSDLTNETYTLVRLEKTAHLYRDRGGKNAIRHVEPGAPEPYDNVEDGITHVFQIKKVTQHVVSPLTPGQFFPRVWRDAPSPEPDDANLRSEVVASSRSLALLESRLAKVFEHIEPVPAHDAVYSYELRQLLILASTEVEAGWKAIMKAHNAKPLNGKRFTRADYVKLVRPMRLEEWEVTLTAQPGYPPIRPFAGWGGSSNPLAWYDDYNDTKHDREAALPRAKLGSVLAAMAGAYVMHAAQFGEDYTFLESEFRITSKPVWSLAERYIDPLLQHPQTGQPIGTWTPMLLAL